MNVLYNIMYVLLSICCSWSDSNVFFKTVTSL